MWLIALVSLGPAFCLELQNPKYARRLDPHAVELCQRKWRVAHKAVSKLISRVNSRLRFRISDKAGTMPFHNVVRDLIGHIAREIQSCSAELDADPEDPINMRESETKDDAELLTRHKLVNNLASVAGQWGFLLHFSVPLQRERRWRPKWLDRMVAEPYTPASSS
jgi:hypothetical protein